MVGCGGVVRCGGVVGCGGEWSVEVWWGVGVSEAKPLIANIKSTIFLQIDPPLE